MKASQKAYGSNSFFQNYITMFLVPDHINNFLVSRNIHLPTGKLKLQWITPDGVGDNITVSCRNGKMLGFYTFMLYYLVNFFTKFVFKLAVHSASNLR